MIHSTKNELKQDIGVLENRFTKIEDKLENDITNKVKVLFEDRKNMDKVSR